MDRRQSDASIDELKRKLIRLVISSYGEVDVDNITEEQIQSWLQKLDIVNQGRVKYLETLTDFLYEGLRPLLIKDGIILSQSEEDNTEEASTETETPLQETQARSIPEKIHSSPFPESLTLPKAAPDKNFVYTFDLEQYYNGHILSPEIEGLDSVRGMEFSFSDLELKGAPKEPGVYDMVLRFLREDQMERDVIRVKFIVEPDQDSLPKEIAMPIGRVDEEYEEMVKLDRSYKFNFQVEGAAEIGMDFDPDTMLLVGTPTRAGTFFLTLHFSWEGMREKNEGSVVLRIEVEEAKESFWQNIFPDPNSKFPKDINEHKGQEAKDLWMTGASVRGLRHKHLGLHREDDFQIRFSKRSGWSIITLADGHPDAGYARKGSELASKVAEQVVNKRLELFFEGEKESAEDLILGKGEDSEKKMEAFLNYTLTTAVYNAYLYIKRFAESESESLQNFATTLKILICYPLGKKGYFVAGTCIGEGAIGIYHDKKHTLELIQDSLPLAEDKSPHLLTNAGLTENTKLMNANIKRFILEDFSYIALMSSGTLATLFFGERSLESPSSWSHYWHQLKKQVFHTKSSEFSQKLLDWLENPTENKEAFEDRTLVLLTHRIARK